MIGLLAGVAEEFEARVILRLLHRDRVNLFGDQAGEPLMQSHAQSADALAAQAEGGGQQQIGAVRLQQIR